MSDRIRRIGSCLPAAILIGLAGALAGCDACGIVAGTVGVTAAGARAPAHEMEQIYYLGVFDPQEQVPPTVYRITVRGQASFISAMRFASGWVPAKLIDSLNTDITLDPTAEEDALTITKGEKGTLSQLQTGRRLILFGPEGFREAPKDHRLVIVMGSSPEEYFKAIDQVLGALDPAKRSAGRMKQLLFDEFKRMDLEKARLARLEENLGPQVKGGGQ